VTTTPKACEDTPKGSVCAQDPAAKTQVSKNDTITLTVSTGAPKVAVPNVIGDQEDEATAELKGDKYGLDVKTEAKESDEDPGTVLKTDPIAGEEVEKGSTITLTIAKEKKQSTVPDVTGKTCDEAKAQMQANNLVGVCTDVETDDDNLIGKVISTSPSANSQADPGSEVSIQVGKASEDEEQAQVPNVVGQQVKQAKETLKQAGFNNVQFAPGSDQGDEALVTAQDPQQGTPADPKSQVITLSTASFGNGGNGNGGGDGGIFGGVDGTSARTED
jgi:eukaryotic-like serine/threonine-protein kinase